MIQFNELRVTQDGRYLVIDVQVQNLKYYEDVTIDSIHVDTQKTFSELGPSDRSIYSYVVGAEDNPSGEDPKHIRLNLDIDTIGDNLFFIWVVTKGTPSEDSPCGMRDPMGLGIAYNKYPFYLMAMKGLQSLEGCNISMDFLQMVYQLKALELSLKTGNYRKAISYWNRFFKKSKQAHSHGCGCYGKL